MSSSTTANLLFVISSALFKQNAYCSCECKIYFNVLALCSHAHKTLFIYPYLTVSSLRIVFEAFFTIFPLLSTVK